MSEKEEPKGMEEGVQIQGDLPEDYQEALSQDEQPWLNLTGAELADQHRDFSGNPKFEAWCKKVGLTFGEKPDLHTTMRNVSGDGMNIADLAQLLAETTSRIMAGQQGTVARVSPSQESEATDWVEFPKEIKVEIDGPGGKKAEHVRPLYRIILGGEEYAETGFYRKEVASRLKEEIEGARFVHIPRNAAYVSHVFRIKNEAGRMEAVREHFFYPGEFACKSLAEDLERQVRDLEEFTLPDGEIPGSQTKYDDIVTNGIRLTTGFTYRVPPAMRRDLERRLKSHEESFQNLHKQRKSIGAQGYQMLAGIFDMDRARSDQGITSGEVSQIAGDLHRHGRPGLVTR